MGMNAGGAYIRVPPDLLDDLFIEVARVAEEVLAELESVLQAVEDIVHERSLAALPQLGKLIGARGVDLLDPGVVVLSGGVGYVLLELDDVRVGDDFGVRRRENGGGVAMNGLMAELGRRCDASRERESDEAAHDETSRVSEVDQPATSTQTKTKDARKDKKELPRGLGAKESKGKRHKTSISTSLTTIREMGGKRDEMMDGMSG